MNIEKNNTLKFGYTFRIKESFKEGYCNYSSESDMLTYKEYMMRKGRHGHIENLINKEWVKIESF
jgi:hypothetical protein